MKKANSTTREAHEQRTSETRVAATPATSETTRDPGRVAWEKTREHILEAVNDLAERRESDLVFERLQDALTALAALDDQLPEHGASVERRTAEPRKISLDGTAWIPETDEETAWQYAKSLQKIARRLAWVGQEALACEYEAERMPDMVAGIQKILNLIERVVFLMSDHRPRRPSDAERKAAAASASVTP